MPPGSGHTPVEETNNLTLTNLVTSHQKWGGIRVWQFEEFGKLIVKYFWGSSQIKNGHRNLPNTRLTLQTFKFIGATFIMPKGNRKQMLTRGLVLALLNFCLKMVKMFHFDKDLWLSLVPQPKATNQESLFCYENLAQTSDIRN